MQSTLTAAALTASILAASCASSPERGETRRFAVLNRFEVQVPEGTGELRGWFALPDDREEFQSLSDLAVAVDAPPGAEVEEREVRDGEGNRFLYLAVRGADGGALAVETAFEVERREVRVTTDPGATRAPNEDERRELAPFLEEDTHVRPTPEIRAAAAAAVGDAENPMVQARRLYDWVLEHVQYWVKDPDRLKSSGVGSSAYAFEECTGNCTDFHSLYAAAARSTGIPTRMVYGSLFKGPLDGEDRDQSYHCWIEFHAPEVGWVPVDVALADLFVADFPVTETNREKVALTLADGYAGPDPALVDYYFGNLDARRVTWHRGRDLRLEPPPSAGALNASPRPTSRRTARRWPRGGTGAGP